MMAILAWGGPELGYKLGRPMKFFFSFYLFIFLKVF